MRLFRARRTLIGRALDAEGEGEAVQLRLTVGKQVAPPAAVPVPDRLVDIDGHRVLALDPPMPYARGCRVKPGNDVWGRGVGGGQLPAGQAFNIYRSAARSGRMGPGSGPGHEAVRMARPSPNHRPRAPGLPQASSPGPQGPAPMRQSPARRTPCPHQSRVMPGRDPGIACRMAGLAGTAAGLSPPRPASSAGWSTRWCTGTPAACPDRRSGRRPAPSRRPRGSPTGSASACPDTS